MLMILAGYSTWYEHIQLDAYERPLTTEQNDPLLVANAKPLAISRE
jgi:hypothetical protein